MWKTCNGAPDAIGFTVDRPGLAIAGAGVFGSGALMEYELELLVEKVRCPLCVLKIYSPKEFTDTVFGLNTIFPISFSSHNSLSSRFVFS
jgi:hypothetical protein